VTVQLEDVSVTADSPFSSDSASATIVLDGLNSLVSTSYVSAGVGCSDAGNLTIEAIGSGSLVARGGTSAPGVGPGYSLSCSFVRINGGSVTAVAGSSGAGIGTGSSQSRLSELTITNAAV
jgi:hypothetical protein